MSIHVMATNLAQAYGVFEPQRQHNWDFSIASNLYGSEEHDIISLSLATGFLPRVSNEEVAIPYGNEYVFVAGKAVHEAGTLVLRDWVDRQTVALLYQWRLQVYDPRTGAIGLARNYKKTAALDLTGPNVAEGTGTGAIQDVLGEFVPQNLGGGGLRNVLPSLRSWELVGCWPISFNPAANGLDMGSSGQVMVEMVVRYDKAVPLDLSTALQASGAGQKSTALAGDVVA